MEIVRHDKDGNQIILEKISDNYVLIHCVGNSESPFVFFSVIAAVTFVNLICLNLEDQQQQDLN